MLQDLSATAAEYGLKLCFRRTIVLTWKCLAVTCLSIPGLRREVNMLNEVESEIYLGRKWCFEECHLSELENRSATGWTANFNYVPNSSVCVTVSSSSMLSPLLCFIAASTRALTQSMGSKPKTVRRKISRHVSTFTGSLGSHRRDN